MTEEKWKLVWDLYRNARNVPVAQRASFVKAAIDDSAIAGEVLALLSSQSSSGETSVGIVARVAAIESGRRIGRYTVKRMLGRGGMGETWSAQDMELERTVALKFLRQAAPQDSSSAERFIREARAASALNHPNIVTVFEVVRSEQDLAIAMELVDGEGLRGLCGTPQPVARVLRIGEQIAEALAAAHAANILHRDIKPENLIVRSDGYVKVLDFGLARRLDAGTITHPGMPAGTFRYMSPEQSRGQRLTAGSDVFSLGVVLFELVAGSHPFPAESALEAMMAIGSAEPKWLADVSPGTPGDLAKVIGTMLAKDPAARPSAGSIAGRLREIRQELSQSGDSQPAKALALRRRSAVKYGLAALPAAAIGVYGWRHFPKARPGSFEAVPFEGDRGLSHASEPAFSPDGRTVAYVARVPVDPANIWAKRLTGAPVQLTFGNAEKGSPVWSPDGASIAFIQMTGFRLAEIRIIPAAGGPSRKLLEILSPQAGHLYFPGPSLCWSPDPSWLAVSCRQSPQDSYSLFLVHIETGETRQLTDSTGSEHGDSCPSFSPDGKTLAFSRLDWANRLYVVPIDSRMNSAGPPRLLETGKPWNASPAWTADGKELIASCGMSNPKLMRISPWLDRAPEALSGVGESGWFPAVSRTRGDRRLIYVKRLLATGMWRLDLTVRGGVPVAAREPVKIIPAEAENFEPMWAPDSQRFAFTSSRSGYRELWVSDRDGAMPVQWTYMQASDVSDPRWLADGRVMFCVVKEGLKDVYVMSAPPSKPQRLLKQRVARAVPSPDGKWIYFQTIESFARSEIWKTPAGLDEPKRLTEGSGYNMQVSPDGHMLYYARIREGEVWVWSVDVRADSVAARVPKPLVRNADTFCPGKRGIYFCPQPGAAKAQVLVYQDLASGNITPVYSAPALRVEYKMGLAPDESSLLYASRELDSATLTLVEGFR